ncbi:hypothetical protein FACS1894167_12220 [Synergistales bacterium]|nr:hypothetical protein FACS1894167_12220 [Synergistales bacterium]
MRDEAAEVKDRLRASELLGKSEGDFITRTEITGKDGGIITGIDFSTRSTEELIAISGEDGGVTLSPILG